MSFKLIQLVLLLLAFLLELCNGASISGCIADERNALLDFKKNLKDKHSRLASWKYEDCCYWEGVSCNNVTGYVVRLDLRNPHHFSEDDDVLYNEWSLRGQLSSSLLGLKHLNYLDLSMNHFNGPIPKFVGSFHNLRYLNLSLAGFNGLIPPHIGNLSRLRYLDLNNGMQHGNQYMVDEARWVSGLTSLEHLTMKYIKFENIQDWMEALNMLPNIAELCLSSCDISAFPVSLPYVNFTNLSYLDLSSNYIKLESIPLWLFNIKSLTYIDLSSNSFSSIPDALMNLTSLKYIDFSSNVLSGAVPQALKSLKDTIENLDLSYNQFNGSLPDWFGELHKLKTLNLLSNLLSGCIPESLGGLVALQVLYLSSNNLNGTIPKSIGQLSNLTSLDLSENLLEGDISNAHFARLTKLKELSLSSNNLNLNVSRDWIPPFKLKVIDMGSCKLGPKFPAWLQTQANLSFLNLSSNGIVVDSLPDLFWDVFSTYSYDESITLDISDNGINGSLPLLSKLSFHYVDLSSNFFYGPLPLSLNISYYLDLSNNSFSGPIQSVIDNNGGLLFIHLTRNNFSGEIPLSICQPHLDWVDVSRNSLTGELPNCWNTLKHSPTLLDFSINKLTGNIPHTLGTLTGLQSLHLGYNSFSGNIPTTLRNCTDLTTLDLSTNKLTDTIPTWLGENLTNLKALVLRSNNFVGNIPSTLSKLEKLQILDLGNNKLCGRIPQSFGNFKVMMNMHSTYQDSIFFMTFPSSKTSIIEYLQLYTKGRDRMYDKLLAQITIIDLSSNNLSGQILKELGNLQRLIFLNLSGNHLIRSIPDEVGSMHALESLDLSRNGLSGHIPLSFSTMTTFNNLNLSYNNLSGKIPSGNQLQTLTNESYIGNPELCGFPLTQSCDSNKTTSDEVPADEVTELHYLYVIIALGFVFGFWIVWVTLLLKKEWKDAYLEHIDYMYDSIKAAITGKCIYNCKEG